MEIGKRLRQLRESKELSQGNIERHTGLLRCYLSRAENGHMVPSLPVLERWAEALEISLAQLFASADDETNPIRLPKGNPIGRQERTLLGLFNKVRAKDKALLISLARKMAKGAGHSALS